MVVFTAADLQRRPADLQRAALREPTYLTYHEKLRYVFLSIEDYVRLGGVAVEVSPRGLPSSLMKRLLELATRHDTVEFEGGSSRESHPAVSTNLSGLVYRRRMYGSDVVSDVWAVALIELQEGEELRDATAKGINGSDIAADFRARSGDFLSLQIQSAAPVNGQTGVKMPMEVAERIGSDGLPYLIVSKFLLDSLPQGARIARGNAVTLPGALISSIASKILQLAKSR